MITVNIYNGKSKLSGNRADIGELRELYKIKSPNAFWSPARRSGVWDGYVRYITEERGLVSTGLLPELIELMDKHEYEYELVDKRDKFKDLNEVTSIKGDKLFEHQSIAVRSVLDYRLQDVRFTRGIVWAATNAGKSYMMAAVIASFSSKRRSVILIDEVEVYTQMVADFKEFFPGEVGEIHKNKCELDKRIVLAMVPTLKLRIEKDLKVRTWTQTIDIIQGDECDKATSATWTKCLNNFWNAPVRVGYSGTAQLHKDPIKNRMIVAFFGPVIYRITNKELVTKGISTKPIFKIFMGSEQIRRKGDYKQEYDEAITYNIKRNKKIWRRVRKNISKKRLPIVVIYKFKNHAKELLRLIPKDIRENYSIDYMDSGCSKGHRESAVQRFKEGKLDILLASYVLKRGKNLPLMNVIINASSGDSHTNILQLLGRLLRKDDSKKIVYLEDFFDKGAFYLQRHSKHRIRFYKEEGFEVRELYKK